MGGSASGISGGDRIGEKLNSTEFLKRLEETQRLREGQTPAEQKESLEKLQKEFSLSKARFKLVRDGFEKGQDPKVVLKSVLDVKEDVTKTHRLKATAETSSGGVNFRSGGSKSVTIGTVTDNSATRRGGFRLPSAFEASEQVERTDYPSNGCSEKTMNIGRQKAADAVAAAIASQTFDAKFVLKNSELGLIVQASEQGDFYSPDALQLKHEFRKMGYHVDYEDTPDGYSFTLGFKDLYGVADPYAAGKEVAPLPTGKLAGAFEAARQVSPILDPWKRSSERTLNIGMQKAADAVASAVESGRYEANFLLDAKDLGVDVRGIDYVPRTFDVDQLEDQFRRMGYEVSVDETRSGYRFALSFRQ